MFSNCSYVLGLTILNPIQQISGIDSCLTNFAHSISPEIVGSPVDSSHSGILIITNDGPLYTLYCVMKLMMDVIQPPMRACESKPCCAAKLTPF
jgi:hypothetical protein